MRYDDDKKQKLQVQPPGSTLEEEMMPAPSCCVGLKERKGVADETEMTGYVGSMCTKS